MRVALAHKLFRYTGGAEVFFRQVERILRDQGHETLMIATGEPGDATEDDNVLLLNAPEYDKGGALAKARHLPAAIYDLSKKAAIKAALERFRPNVVHVFAMNVHLSPAVVFAAKELEIPVVGTFNDYKHICPNYKLFHHGHICYDCKGYKFFSAVKNSCCKESLALSAASMIEAYAHKWMRVYEHFDHFTFSSDFLANVTGDFWNDRVISWSKLLNPFDSASFEASDDYEPYGLFFGRLIDEKGVDRLVEAASLIDGFPIKVVGDGPDMPMLQAMAARGCGNIEFLGPRWGEALDEVLRLARFVVVPSVWQENFPYVINQAFAYARPVIGSRRGGIPELVSHGERGLIVEPDDREELAAAMRLLATDVGEARRLGREAKAWSDRTFNDERALADLLHAYRAAGACA